MRSMVGGCRECWRLEAVISKPALLSRWTQLWTLCACPRMSPLPLVAFTLLPIHIYLFIDFYEVSLPSNPYCPCCPGHPCSHPVVCAAVRLSFTRKIKTASSRTYVWSMGRDDWQYRELGELGQGCFSLVWASKRGGMPSPSNPLARPSWPLASPLFLKEENLWPASPSEVSGILAGPLNHPHHPVTRLWWPPPLFFPCSIITTCRMLGSGVAQPTPKSWLSLPLSAQETGQL